MGLMHLSFPFAWDQAVFVMGAEVVAHGGALYRDFWDSNQPGIFFFYAAAGRLFGFTEAGIHALELILLLVLAVAIVVGLRKSFIHPISLALAPVLVVGYQYAITSDWHLTQKESLVGVPLFLALLFALRGSEREQGRARHFAFSGFAGGVVFVTKLLLMPIVGAFWTIGMVRLVMARERGGRIAGSAAALAVGAAVPIAATALILAREGSLEAAIWTAFEFPMQAMTRVTAWNSVYFVDSLKWIGTQWIPLWVFGAPGAIWALRRDRWLAIGLLAWLGVGATCLVVQRLSGWQYQFMLLLPPSGILAAFGVDGLLERLRLRLPSPAAFAVTLGTLAVLSIPAALATARKIVHLSHCEWALTPHGRWAFQVETSRGNAYGRWQKCSAFLSDPDAQPGPIYVIGDPLMYWISGRRPAVPRCGGTMMNQLTRAEWVELVRGIDRTTPYVFVSHADQHLLEVLRPTSDPMLTLLEQQYHPLVSDECGVWYRRSR